ncbi:hypothetical protein BDF19DRAFT_325691 [Syncephalis fuscata]|nr:hypothetical protein BDF19DRAFT_325691 [Syncephalis fuscata]
MDYPIQYVIYNDWQQFNTASKDLSGALSTKMDTLYQYSLIMAQLAFAPIIICYSFFTLEEKVGCMDYYPRNFLWYWFLIDVPINILFPSIFCYVAIKHYCLFESKAWKRLALDGIQTITLSTLCGAICSTFIITSIGKAYSDHFFIVDW